MWEGGFGREGVFEDRSTIHMQVYYVIIILSISKIRTVDETWNTYTAS
jgi:hypothetical protein